MLVIYVCDPEDLFSTFYQIAAIKLFVEYENVDNFISNYVLILVLV